MDVEIDLHQSRNWQRKQARGGLVETLYQKVAQVRLVGLAQWCEAMS